MSGAGERRRRRLLILTPFPPRFDAPHGGGRVIAQVAARLAGRHDVSLLTLRSDNEPPVDPAVAERCAAVREIHRDGADLDLLGRWKRLARLALALPRGTPSWAVDWRVPAFERAVRQQVATWKPEVVQAELAVMGQYLAAVERGLRILVEHDPGRPAAADALASARGARRLFAHAELRSWCRYERRVLADADAIVTFTERDRAAMSEVEPRTAIWRIPLGIDLPQATLDPRGTEPAILFVGNFDHPPNVEAALRLAGSVFAKVTARRADARLILVGPSPPPELLQAAGPAVSVTGRVDDVGPYLHRAAVVAVPLRRGGGMRVKILEALAAGKATVASPLALEGLDGLVEGRDVVAADADDELAEALVALLDDPERREAIGRSARLWAETHLRWEDTIEAFERLYDHFLEREH